MDKGPTKGGTPNGLNSELYDILGSLLNEGRWLITRITSSIAGASKATLGKSPTFSKTRWHCHVGGDRSISTSRKSSPVKSAVSAVLSACMPEGGCLTRCGLISGRSNHVIRMALRWTRPVISKEKASGHLKRTDRSSMSLMIGPS